MSAQLVQLHVASRHDVAATLREIAGLVEDGVLGEGECEGVVVLNSAELNVLAVGKTDPGTLHLLLHAGMLKLANTLL